MRPARAVSGSLAAVTTILVAAEAAWVRDQVRTGLTGPGQRVIEVTRGQDVRDAVGAQTIDLVILDLQIANQGGIATALEQAGRARDVVFITHELTDDTRRALIDGTIDIIINQDAGHEVRSAIRVLMSKADKLPIVEQMERIRIDIYLRDNIP